MAGPRTGLRDALASGASTEQVDALPTIEYASSAEAEAALLALIGDPAVSAGFRRATTEAQREVLRALAKRLAPDAVDAGRGGASDPRGDRGLGNTMATPASRGLGDRLTGPAQRAVGNGLVDPVSRGLTPPPRPLRVGPDGVSSAGVGQSTLPTGAQSQVPQVGGSGQSRRPPWRDLTDQLTSSASAAIKALLEQVRITPRLTARYPWGEVHAFMALSLKKARARSPNWTTFGPVRLGAEIGVPEFSQGLDAATKLALIKYRGIKLTELGVTTDDGSLHVGFNLQATPLFPVAIEVEWATLLTHEHQFPGYDMEMDFEVTLVVEATPSVDEIKRRAGQIIYRAQRFFEQRSGRIIRWGRGVVQGALRRGGIVLRGAALGLWKAGSAASRLGPAVRAVGRGAAIAIQAAELPLSSAIFLGELLHRLGSISWRADDVHIDGVFMGGFVQLYHALAASSSRRRDLEIEAYSPGMVMLAGFPLDMTDLDPQFIVSYADIDQGRRVDLLGLDWALAYSNCMALYHQARRLGRSSRGERVRGAIEGMMHTVGSAAALQEIYAYIATQSAYEYHIGGGILDSVNIRERDGVAAWEALADAYVALVEARNRLRSTPIPPWKMNMVPDRDYYKLVLGLYIEAGGFPLLPEEV
jgi:hypothetical protein